MRLPMLTWTIIIDQNGEGEKRTNQNANGVNNKKLIISLVM